MKRIVAGTLLGLLLALPAGAQTKLGTVDLRKLFDNYHKRQDAEAAIKVHYDKLQQDYKEQVDDYNKLQDEYKRLVASANDMTASTEERAKRKSLADAKNDVILATQRALQQYQAKANDDLESEKKRMRDGILAEIRNVINAKAKAGGFTMVLDSAADSLNQAPVLLYTNGENDLTDSVLATLNAVATMTPEPVKPDGKK